MNIIEAKLNDVKILAPQMYEDERGYFLESFNQATFNKLIGKDVQFVQDNHSYSKQGVLRGLHYQIAPMAQAKLVRVVTGEVYCVVVDLRKNSSTYLQWMGIILSSGNGRQLWVPEGFAHGFYVLSKAADYLYKTTNHHAPEYERFLIWNDSALAIEWPISGAPILSKKDANAFTLKQLEQL